MTKTIGQKAQEFRLSRGWNYTRMAQEVSRLHGKAVSRQAITQLEDVGNRTPHYLPALAKLMGTTSDELLLGKSFTPSPVPPPPGIELAVAVLADALDMMDASSRERAGVLLGGLVKDRKGPWARWLTDVILESIPSPTSPGYTKQPSLPLNN